MYREWLYLTTKWATKGLDPEEMKSWHKLTTELEKHCHDCAETFECGTCGNTGLQLNDLEKMIVRNIERSLDLHRTNSVN